MEKREDFVVVVKRYVVSKGFADQVSVEADNGAERGGAAHALKDHPRPPTDAEWKEFLRE